MERRSKANRTLRVASGVALLLGLAASVHPARAGRDAGESPPAGNPVALGLLEALLRRELVQRLGPADPWLVKVEREASSQPVGRFLRASADCTRVRTREGLLVDRLRIVLENVRLDESDVAIREMGRARVFGRLSAADLEAYVGPRVRSDVKDVRVRFRGAKICVRGVARTRPLGLRVEARGVPRLAGNQVLIDVERAAVARLRVPGRVLERFERRVNPVVDLGQLGMPVHGVRVRVAGNFLEAEARMEFRGEAVTARDSSADAAE
jgi:hypothetical protein